MRKSLLSLLFFLAAIVGAHAQDPAMSTISASSIIDSFGHAIPTAKLCFQPVDGTKTATAFAVGSTQILPTEVCGKIISGALVAGTQLVPSTGNSAYHTYLKSSTNSIIWDYGYHTVTGPNWTLDGQITNISPATVQMGNITTGAPGSGAACSMRAGGGSLYYLDCTVPQGATGPPATVKGPWSSTASYTVGDVVSYLGSSYVALQPSTNVTPVIGATWGIQAAGSLSLANTLISQPASQYNYATATAICYVNKDTSVTISPGFLGYGYSSAPTITVGSVSGAGPITVTPSIDAVGEVTAYVVSGTNSGYTKCPGLTVAPPTNTVAPMTTLISSRDVLATTPVARLDDFGCVGDGVHDDSHCVNSTIAYATANGTKPGAIAGTAGKTYYLGSVTGYARLGGDNGSCEGDSTCTATTPEPQSYIGYAVNIPSHLTIFGNGSTFTTTPLNASPSQAAAWGAMVTGGKYGLSATAGNYAAFGGTGTAVQFLTLHDVNISYSFMGILVQGSPGYWFTDNLTESYVIYPLLADGFQYSTFRNSQMDNTLTGFIIGGYYNSRNPAGNYTILNGDNVIDSNVIENYRVYINQFSSAAQAIAAYKYTDCFINYYWSHVDDALGAQDGNSCYAMYTGAAPAGARASNAGLGTYGDMAWRGVAGAGLIINSLDGRPALGNIVTNIQVKRGANYAMILNNVQNMKMHMLSIEGQGYTNSTQTATTCAVNDTADSFTYPYNDDSHGSGSFAGAILIAGSTSGDSFDTIFADGNSCAGQGVAYDMPVSKPYITTYYVASYLRNAAITVTNDSVASYLPLIAPSAQPNPSRFVLRGKGGTYFSGSTSGVYEKPFPDNCMESTVANGTNYYGEPFCWTDALLNNASGAGQNHTIGFGPDSPNVQFSWPNVVFALSTRTNVGGVMDSIQVTNGGSGYVNPTVSFLNQSAASNCTPYAQAVVGTGAQAGQITAINVTFGGCYMSATNAPDTFRNHNLVISDTGGGSGAQAFANITNTPKQTAILGYQQDGYFQWNPDVAGTIPAYPGGGAKWCVATVQPQTFDLRAGNYYERVKAPVAGKLSAQYTVGAGGIVTSFCLINDSSDTDVSWGTGSGPFFIHTSTPAGTGNTPIGNLVTANVTPPIWKRGWTETNGADSSLVNTLQAGATANQTEGFSYVDFGGTVRWFSGMNSSTHFVINDNPQGVSRLDFTQAGQSLINAGNGGYAVACNMGVNSGTGGCIFGSGGPSPTQVGKVDSSGNASFNGKVSGASVATTVYTFATLPTCNSGSKGLQAVISDASSPTYLGTLSGGGSTVTAALCNGTTWVSH